MNPLVIKCEERIKNAKSFEDKIGSLSSLKGIQNHIYSLVIRKGLTQEEANALTDKIKRRAEDFGVWF